MIVEMPDNNSVVRWKKNDNEKWKYAEISDLITAYEKRPQGKKIKKEQYGWVYCSECDSLLGQQDKFCWNCGADMRGDTK